MNFKNVSKQEFFKFIEQRSNLGVGGSSICDPPVRWYMDKSRKFPDNIVARTFLDPMGISKDVYQIVEEV
jgi:hypothetical protein